MKRNVERVWDSGNPAALSALANGDMANALLAATPGGIEAQEAQGQRDLCSSGQRLPKDVDRAAAERLGIKFGAGADDIFVYAELPQGWKIKPTDHSMWSDLVDGNGFKRGAIFYKAAFYDRSAHMRFSTRYYVTAKYQDVSNYDNGNKRYEVIDSASPEPLFTTEWFDGRKYPNPDEERLGQSATAWLEEHFPDHKDIAAYWA